MLHVLQVCNSHIVPYSSTRLQTVRYFVLTFIYIQLLFIHVENWIDLTPAAFKLLSRNGDLNIGVLDISWKSVPCSEVEGHLPPQKDKTDKKDEKQ